MKKTIVEPTHLEKEIDSVLSQMESYTPETDEYIKMADQLVKLYQCVPAKEEPLVRVDTIVAAVVNIAGILAVLGFEHGHVITSKAFNFIVKSKL